MAQALRAHDDTLAEYLDERRRAIGGNSCGGRPGRELPSWLHLTGTPVPDAFASAIQSSGR
ncbi:hypothetical protein ACWD4V_01685 [Streptomyces tsukubensis]